MNELILTHKPSLFFSKDDEKLCLRWIKKIKSIVKTEKSNNQFYLYTNSNIIPAEDIYNLIALFRRYGGDSQQLQVFINPHNKDFFERLDGIDMENYHKVYPQREIEALSKTEVYLKCKPLRFYTKNDENLMFGLIDKIKSVTQCYGIGQTLYIAIDRKKISLNDIANLKALFSHYQFNQKQLNKFASISKIKS